MQCSIRGICMRRAHDFYKNLTHKIVRNAILIIITSSAYSTLQCNDKSFEIDFIVHTHDNYCRTNCLIIAAAQTLFTTLVFTRITTAIKTTVRVL